MSIVTLLTDFGTQDGYVGAVKGEILKVCPRTHLVDISHDIRPQDVLGGAFAIRTYAPHYHSDSVHLAVIDPGVGTDRAGIVVTTPYGRWVGPDNGLFEFLFDDASEVRCIENLEDWARPIISNTFHARDVFGPVAGHLAAGRELATLGSVTDEVERFDLPEPTVETYRAVGLVTHVDRFGNLVTNIPGADIKPSNSARVFIGQKLVGAVRRTYEDVGVGQSLALVGHSLHLEVSIRNGDAAAYFRAGRGAPVEVVTTDPIGVEQDPAPPSEDYDNED